MRPLLLNPKPHRPPRRPHQTVRSSTVAKLSISSARMHSYQNEKKRKARPGVHNRTTEDAVNCHAKTPPQRALKSLHS